MWFETKYCILIAVFCCCQATLGYQNIHGKKLNVLFLVSDDMRPNIGAYYGPDFPSSVHPPMHTPNLDALAGRSLLLKRAYVQQAVCSPSRTSLLTGRRPDTTRVFDLQHYFRSVAGNFTTIPQYFKEHGYITTGMGKIFHPGRASNNDDPISWTEPYYQPQTTHWAFQQRHSWYAVDDEETIRYPLPDQLTAQHAVETLKRLAPKGKTGEQPFFIAVGFHKPHLPWVFPKSFLNIYPQDFIHLPPNPHAPNNMPEIAWSDFDELRSYVDIQFKYGHGDINTTLPDDLVQDLRRAYYSAISYTDSLVGQVVDSLVELGLANNTIVSFWGDHGWQIGEHGEWCKHTNFDIAAHAPMMVHVPGLTDNGVTTERLTEFVDLFPTLVEAAGLPAVPICPDNSKNIETCTEGVSFVPLMKYPARKWKPAVFFQYPRMFIHGDMMMGYSIRTSQYQYTEWLEYDVYESKPFDWIPMEVELYDQQIDPNENKNVAVEQQYSHIIQTLHKQLQEGWRAALPQT